MGLRIARFATTCHVPPSHGPKAGLVDHLARGRFAKDLGAHLGPSLARQSAIVRIRKLSLRVVIPGPEMNEESLSRAWTQAFGKALFTALQYPSGAAPIELFRADSLADYLAGAIRDLLQGAARSQWYYAEFAEIFERSDPQAALTLLCKWPRHTLPTLIELARTGALESLFARLDDLAFETIFQSLATPEDAEASLSAADLIFAVRCVQRDLSAKLSTLRSRQYALRLFVHSWRAGDRQLRARSLHYALSALWLLVTARRPPGDSVPDSLQSLFADLGENAKRLSAPILELLASLANEMRLRPQSPRLTDLYQRIAELRIQFKVPFEPAIAPARTLASDWCGLFFLAPILNRLGWIHAWRRTSYFREGGVSSLLAGIALSIAGKFDSEAPNTDPGIALFAGDLEDLNPERLRSLLNQYPQPARDDVLKAALPTAEAAATWDAVFDRLADVLIAEFAGTLRGFRQAVRASIVRTFLQRGGAIRIDGRCIVVVPDPSPYHVVLRIAGLDRPVESVSWLGGRRLEFEVGDL
jgi:hypothetical protein